GVAHVVAPGEVPRALAMEEGVRIDRALGLLRRSGGLVLELHAPSSGDGFEEPRQRGRVEVQSRAQPRRRRRITGALEAERQLDERLVLLLRPGLSGLD